MATQVQIRKGTTAQHASFTGAVAELSVDTDKKTVVVHDGSTAGGVPLVTNTRTETITGTKTFSNAVLTTSSFTNNPTLSGGTANGVAYLNGSKVVTTGSGLVFDGTNLGIGTNSPLGKLDARGDLYVGANARILITEGGTGDAVIGGRAGTAFLSLTVNGSEQARLTSTGLGIGTSSPAEKLDVNGGIAARASAALSSGAGAYLYYTSGTTSAELTALNPGVAWLNQKYNALNHIWNNSGTEQMRLTSTGLGIGTSSPSYKLEVYDATNPRFALSTGASGNAEFRFATPSSGYQGLITYSAASNFMAFYTSATERMRLDSSGNLGLGVTPSAWGSGYTGFDIKYLGISNTGAGTVDCSFTQNGYYNGTNWIAKYTSPSKRFSISDNGFAFFNGASATAGNAITFTQAMTLDASGNLGIGTTSPTSNRRLDAVTNVNASGGLRVVNSNAGASASANTSYSNGSISHEFGILGTGYTTYGVLTANSAYIYAGGGSANVQLAADGGYVAFGTGTGSAERARIDSSGNLLVGDTTSGTVRLRVTNTASDDISIFKSSNATPYGVNVVFSGASPNNTSSYFYTCSDSGSTTRFKVYSNGGIANYSANNVNLSDQRVKTDIQDAGSYLAKICAIPVRTFKYKDQTDDLLNLGVIAQEVEAVAPELVDTNGFGETPEDGIPLKAIYQTDLQYALMKALQELKAEFDAYKASHP